MAGVRAGKGRIKINLEQHLAPESNEVVKE